jgi:excisionase family DNA binding protein
VGVALAAVVTNARAECEQRDGCTSLLLLKAARSHSLSPIFSVRACGFLPKIGNVSREVQPETKWPGIRDNGGQPDPSRPLQPFGSLLPSQTWLPPDLPGQRIGWQCVSTLRRPVLPRTVLNEVIFRGSLGIIGKELFIIMTTTITIAEFCREMRIGKTTFYKLRNNGEAPSTFEVGGQVRILRSEFERWLAERATRKEAA